MALLAVAASAQAGWNNPGADRFSGNVPAAVQDYKDIPQATRDRLQARMERHDYDDRVTITRDSIDGLWGYVYSPRITDMHFGSAGRIIPVAGREKWPDSLTVEALAYTDGDYTIIVPAICSNVARVVRLPVAPPPVATAGGRGAPLEGGGGGSFAPYPIAPYAGPTQSTVVTYDPGIVVSMLPPPWPLCCGGGGGGWVPPVRPPIPAVPEPASWAMALVGLAGIAARKLSRR